MGSTGHGPMQMIHRKRCSYLHTKVGVVGSRPQLSRPRINKQYALLGPLSIAICTLRCSELSPCDKDVVSSDKGIVVPLHWRWSRLPSCDSHPFLRQKRNKLIIILTIISLTLKKTKGHLKETSSLFPTSKYTLQIR